MLIIGEALESAILGHLPLAPNGDGRGTEVMITIPCTLEGLTLAARQIGDALLALPFSQYLETSDPKPAGDHVYTIRGEGGQIVRLIEQHSIVLDKDVYRLTVHVGTNA